MDKRTWTYWAWPTLLFMGLLGTAVRGTAEEGATKSTSVIVRVDGRQMKVSVPEGSTVQQVLDAAEICLGDLDRVKPSPDTPVKSGTVVSVTRVRVVIEKKEIPLPKQVEVRYSDKLRVGQRKILKSGRDGVAEQLTEVWYRDGVPVLRKNKGTRIVRQAENQIVVVGGRGQQVSRYGLNARKVLVMEATGYSPDAQSCGKWANGRTSLGLIAQYGVVAVDPKVIPLGTRVYVEGYGFAIAADVGGAIKGMRIDLCHDTHKRALAVGRRKVKVYILD